jgi:hypothetical protein
MSHNAPVPLQPGKRTISFRPLELRVDHAREGPWAPRGAIPDDPARGTAYREPGGPPRAITGFCRTGPRCHEMDMMTPRPTGFPGRRVG